MLTYFCIIISFILYRLSSKESLAFARLIFLGFIGLKLSFLLISQSSYLMSTPLLLLMYSLIQLTVIKKAKCTDKSQFAILGLFFISLGYNMLTISQYVMVTYDFYGSYKDIIGPIMISELLLLSWNVKYVADFRESHRDYYINFINRLLCVRRRLPNRGLF